MKKCSVIIPAYNVERYVGQAIESALNQTYSEVEVVVVNDGSTDRTPAEIHPYQDRIVLVEQENRGLSAARNRAIEAATGEYIALLDADDVFLPERVERMVAFLDADSDVTFATSDAFLAYDGRESTDTFYARFKKGRRFRDEDQSYWITQYNFIMIMTVVRKQAFERYGLFDEALRACEDWDLWIRFLTGGARVGLLNSPLAYYRLRAGSLSSDLNTSFKDQLFMLDRAVARAGEASPPSLVARLSIARAKTHLVEGRLDEARKEFRRAAANPHLPGSSRMTAAFAGVMPSIIRSLIKA